MPSFKVLLRAIGAALLLVGLVPFWAASPAASAESATPISAKALTNHECNTAEWHFVITQIGDEADAPAAISVTWATGDRANISLAKFTGGVAHYDTTAHLDSTVSSATTTIYAGWSGQFNLSHGPCGTPADTPVDAVRPSVTPAKCTEGYTLTTPSFTVHATEGVDYYVGNTKITGTVPAVAGSTVVVTASARDGYVLSGASTFSLVFTANPPCQKPGDPSVEAVSPSVTQADCTEGYTLTTPSFAIHATEGVDYYVGDTKITGTVAAVAGSKVVVTARAQEGYVLSGTSTFTLVFNANPPCQEPGPSHVPVNVCHATGSATNPYEFITVDDDSADFRGHLAHRNDPRPNTPADLIGDYTDADGVFHEYDGVITGEDDCVEPDQDTPATAVGPSVTQAQCTADYLLTTPSFTVASTEGVEYFVGDRKVTGSVGAVAGATVVVTARATEGFVLQGTSSFTLVFTANPACVRPPTPPTTVTAGPTFVDSVCLPGAAGSSRSASYTIPVTAGVDYYLGEVKLAAGTVGAADGTSVTITAKAKPGYVLQGPASFTHAFPAPVCDTTLTVPVIPAAAAVPSAVLGVKIGAASAPAAATTAGTLPHTGAGLPLGTALTTSVLFLSVGGLLIALSNRRRTRAVR